MSTFPQTKPTASITRAFQNIFAHIQDLGSAFSGGLSGLAGERAAIKTNHVFDTLEIQQADTLFADAIHDRSNLASDWFWLATRVQKPAQRRYCLHQALTIDPAYEAARRELARMR